MEILITTRKIKKSEYDDFVNLITDGTDFVERIDIINKPKEDGLFEEEDD